MSPSGKQPGFKAFGITPTPLARGRAANGSSRFRKGGRFAAAEHRRPR